MKNVFYFIGILTTLVFSCDGGQSDEKRVEGIVIDDPNSVAAIIRNPVSSNNEEMDTSVLAKITFDEERFNFGEIDEGGKIKHTYTFTNTGAVPLVISDVRSTCGCTVAKWTRKPILPGDKGEIPVNFDSTNKEGKQSKPITITSNAYPSKFTIYLDGFVNK